MIARPTAALVLLAIGATASGLLYTPHPASSASGTPPATRALPDKPSIAVLPFANLSGDPAQDYLADGLTDNLLDALAQKPDFFVIARNATQVYRGKAAAPRAVAADLGVRYVLEGSVQKSGDRIRVTAQLIDAVNDNHLLSQKYDRNLTDLFALEDDLSLQIAGALDVQLSGGHARLIRLRRSTPSLWLASMTSWDGSATPSALLENAPQQWRSNPAVRIWLGLSYALAGRNEQAAAEFAAYRALAPKRTLSYLRRFWSRYYTPQFADRILALSREYGIPEK
jgi:TolB-like protein